MGNHTKNTYAKNAWAEITWSKHMHAQSHWAVKTELQKSKNRGKKGWIRHEIRKQKTTSDDNEFEINLRLEKVVSRTVLKLAVETEEDRRARLENDAATTTQVGHEDRRRKQSKTGEDVSYPQLMLAMIKGVVDVAVVLSSNTFL